MYCKYCGRELNKDERICSQCGTPVKMSFWETVKGYLDIIRERFIAMGGENYSAQAAKIVQWDNLQHTKLVEQLLSAIFVLMFICYELLSTKQFTVTSLYGLHADLNLFEALESGGRGWFFLLYFADVALIVYPFIGIAQRKPKKMLMTIMRLSDIGCGAALLTFINLWNQLDDASGYLGELASLSLSFFGWMFIIFSVASVAAHFVLYYYFDKLIDEAYAVPPQTEESAM